MTAHIVLDPSEQSANVPEVDDPPTIFAGSSQMRLAL